MQIDPVRVHVTPLGVRHQVFRASEDMAATRLMLKESLGIEGPFFLSVSCDIGRKNTQKLVDVYARLAQRGARNDLVLVWRSPPPEVLEQCGRAPLASRVHFVSGPGDVELGDLYRAATAMVFPSIYEGFGLPILEAMACGAPVIASNTTSMPEVGGDAVVYVDPLDDSSIQAAMEMFENGGPGVAGLRERGLKQAAGFTWERCAKETLAVYERYLNA